MSRTDFDLWISKDDWKQYTKKTRNKWYADRRRFVNLMPEGLKKEEYQAFVEKTAHVRDDDLTDYMKQWRVKRC